jgi:hypothetical protein
MAFHSQKRQKNICLGRNYSNIEHRMHNVNCIIDVIDARLPQNGKNYQFSAGSRAPRIVLFTKEDLVDLSDKEKKYYSDLELNAGADSVIWGLTNSHKSDITF